MKYYIKTYGCQMNKSDSERIMALLESAKMEKASKESDADLVVLNICSVRQSAIDRIFGNVKKYRKILKHRPHFKSVITGCVLEKDRNKFRDMFDLVIDIKDIEKLPSLFHAELDSESAAMITKNTPIKRKQISTKNKTTPNTKQKKMLRQVQDEDYSYFNIDSKRESKITAYIPIMTGCNNFCSYCVVPYTRGSEYSRPVEEIISEISVLVKKGYKEIILLGQNVNSYNSRCPNSNIQYSETTEHINFPALLKLINNIPGDFWIRFLTSHPKDMTEELIKTVSECKKCTPYVHLALQSGDDEILSKMNRKYTAKHFLSLVALIRKYMPIAAITTDVIVGFPGETEQQFQHTADVMNKAKFDMVYINKYSPREGTASSKMFNNVSLDEKKRREKVLTDILKNTALENNEKYLEKAIYILVDEIDHEFIYGKSDTFKNVRIKLPVTARSEAIKQSTDDAEIVSLPLATTKARPGQFIKAKITFVDPWGLEGILIP